MNKEFVTYDQALALQELGCGVIMNYKYWRVEKNILVFHNNHNMQSIIDKGFDVECLNVYAPLKQQVFRWFREKYGLYANLFSWLHEEELGTYHEYEIYGNPNGVYGDGKYDTYEEAENNCIDKLLEIATKN